MIRVFLFGFVLSFFFGFLSPPRRVLVNEYGMPVDVHGRPIDAYGNPIPPRNYPQQIPIYDPYGLGGSQKANYSPQATYGRQYTSNQPQQPAPAGQQNYY
jgi:hypothetical protein